MWQADMKRRAGVAAAAVLLLCGAAGGQAVPTGVWQTPAAADGATGDGYVRVLVFRAGLFGGFGHNHVVTHRGVRGCARIEDALADSRVRLDLPVAGFSVDEPAERQAAGERFPVPVPADAAAATRRNMLGPELLDAANHESIELRSRGIRGALPGLEIEFDLDVAGRERRLTLPAAISHDDTTLTVTGTRRLTHAELGLEPYSAAFGTLRVADELVLRYELEFRKVAGERASDCERALAVVDDDRVALAHDGAE